MPMRFTAFLLCSLCLKLSSTDALADNAVQGKLVKPRYDPSAAEEIVRMVLSDNEKTPVVDISPEGPTELVFPGESNVVKCTNTSTYVREAKEEKSSIQSRGGRWFTDIVFYVNDGVLNEQNIEESLKRRPAVICHYEHGGKVYRRQVKFRLNEKRRNAVVFFEREEDREFDEFMNRGMLAPRIITVKRATEEKEPQRAEPKPGAEPKAEPEAPDGGSKPRIITIHQDGKKPAPDVKENPKPSEPDAAEAPGPRVIKVIK